MQTLFITHHSFKLHEMIPGHPECPERLDAISDQLLSSGLIQYVQEMGVEKPASDELLLRVHDRDHIDRLERMSPQQGLVEIDGDTMLNAHSLTAARYAAAAGVQAVDMVMQGRAQT